MIYKFVLDACAILAFLYGEDGGPKVRSVLEDAQYGNSEVYMSKINLLEVYYNIHKAEGVEKAEMFYHHFKTLPIALLDTIDDTVFKEAGRLKSKYRISLADSIALSEAFTRKAGLLTSDHHEFDIIDNNEDITFDWIR